MHAASGSNGGDRALQNLSENVGVGVRSVSKGVNMNMSLNVHMSMSL